MIRLQYFVDVSTLTMCPTVRPCVKRELFHTYVTSLHTAVNRLRLLEIRMQKRKTTNDSKRESSLRRRWRSRLFAKNSEGCDGGINKKHKQKERIDTQNEEEEKINDETAKTRWVTWDFVCNHNSYPTQCLHRSHPQWIEWEKTYFFLLLKCNCRPMLAADRVGNQICCIVISHLIWEWMVWNGVQSVVDRICCDATQ